MQTKQNVVEKTVSTLTVPSFLTEHEFIIDQIGMKIHTKQILLNNAYIHVHNMYVWFQRMQAELECNGAIGVTVN